MNTGNTPQGGMNWGHPGRRFQHKDPIADMGVGNKRPLLIALGIGVAAACGLFLAWEKQAEREEAAATAADTSFADTALASYGGKPSPAEIRAEVEKLLKGNRPDTMMRVMRREDVLPGKGPFIGL